MKFIRKIARSRMCLPVCAALSLMALVYIAFAVRQIVHHTPLAERMMMLPEILTEQEQYIPQAQESEQGVDEETESFAETFTQKEEIELPAAPMPEDSPSEHETNIVPEIQTKPPVETQKPQQTTRPQTQKPTESVTTKPPQTTQKPAQTTKPQATPITAWNVTLKQAKSMVKPDSAYDYEDLYWLSRIISAEAKGESFIGQIGVGTVVLNRVRSKEFPNTVKGVVFDRKYGTQFTPVANGTIYDKPTDSAVIAAKMCLDGYTLSDSVLYFLNPRIATSSWIQKNRKYAFRVGNHDFYY